jgi:hypothetical protein
MMKYYQKWAEFGKIWGKTSKNVKNEVKIQKLLKSVFLNFSKIISREIRENFFFKFLEKFSRRTHSSSSMFIIVYGSILPPSSNNWAAIVG